MKSRLIDTHIHLDLVKNFKEVINEIQVNNMLVVSMTNLPIVYEKFSPMINSKNVRIAVGLHPQLVCEYPNSINDMIRLIPSAKYIGEVGLDLKNKSINEREFQITCFRRIVECCHEEKNKILSIHSKGSVREILNIIPDDFTCSVILHWYTGNLNNVEIAIKRGYYFSINSKMLKSDKSISIVKRIPIDKLLIESDYPFIKEKLVNYVPQVYETLLLLSKVISIDEKSLQNQIYTNFTVLLKKTFY